MYGYCCCCCFFCKTTFFPSYILNFFSCFFLLFCLFCVLRYSDIFVLILMALIFFKVFLCLPEYATPIWRRSTGKKTQQKYTFTWVANEYNKTQFSKWEKWVIVFCAIIACRKFLFFPFFCSSIYLMNIFTVIALFGFFVAIIRYACLKKSTSWIQNNE